MNDYGWLGTGMLWVMNTYIDAMWSIGIHPIIALPLWGGGWFIALMWCMSRLGSR